MNVIFIRSFFFVVIIEQKNRKVNKPYPVNGKVGCQWETRYLPICIYFEKLDPSAQKKYKKRLKVIENTDPSDSDFCVNIGDFPTA